MKKKIFATITALLILVSVIASVPAVMADDDTPTGGFDFYSITIHYNTDVLVKYYETTITVKNEKGKSVKQQVKYFYNTDADSEEGKYIGKKDVAMKSEKLVIPVGTKSQGNFYQMYSPDGAIANGLFYARFPYRNAFITHIVDNSVIRVSSKTDLFGITDPYDDAPYEHQNPNLKYADDGYALAKETDANGANLKIDVNGYLIDTNNNIWLTSDGARVELYTAVPVIRKTGAVKANKAVTEIVESDDYEWVPYADRFDENGKIKNIKSLSYKYYVTEEEYNAFRSDETQTVLKMRRAENDEAYEAANKNGKFVSYVKTVRTDSKKDNATYLNTDRVFTADDIERDDNNFIKWATPRIGTPVVNFEITDITVEVDALGSKLYENQSEDPQQKNRITISLNDCEKNAEFYKKCFEENRYTKEDYDKLMTYVVGSAKSVTTRTEISSTKSDYKGESEFGYSSTVKSISLDASPEIYKSLPTSATLYVNFHIEENQPAEAFDETYQKKFIVRDTANQSTLLTDTVQIKTDADKPDVIKPDQTDSDSSFPTWALILIIVGAVVVVAVVVIIIVVSKKKKASGADTKKDN